MSNPCPGGARSCLIVANGAVPGKRFITDLARGADLLIATDGAASRVLAIGLQPDYVVGDFDSVEPATRGCLPPSSLVYMPDQDRCDLEKAIEYAQSLDCTRVVLTGALGKRLDHALTALSLLIRYANVMDIRIVEPHVEVMPVVRQTEIRGRAGDTLSLIVFAPVKGVTLTGVRWPLNAEDLLPGSRGVSNVMTGDSATAAVTGGCLLVCHLRRSPAA